MDIKSKSTNNEEVNELEVKKDKGNKKEVFKNNKSRKYIVYILTVISLVITILSALEVKDNLVYVVSDRVYTQTQVSEEINSYTNLVEKYSLYYKSSKYAQDKDNITQSDIDICKAELQSKADTEYGNYRNSKYSDNTFNNLTYEQQEKLL